MGASLAGKESACNAGDLGSIPGLGKSPGEGKGYPLQYSGLENSMDSPRSTKKSDMTQGLNNNKETERNVKDSYYIQCFINLKIQVKENFKML